MLIAIQMVKFTKTTSLIWFLYRVGLFTNESSINRRKNIKQITNCVLHSSHTLSRRLFVSILKLYLLAKQCNSIEIPLEHNPPWIDHRELIWFQNPFYTSNKELHDYVDSEIGFANLILKFVWLEQKTSVIVHSSDEF